MPVSVQRVHANQHGRDFVVGDVHGCFSKLSAELDRLKFDPDSDRLFSVGDLVDRGPESLGVVDWLGRPWFHAVRGNHEQFAIDYLEGNVDPDDYRIYGGAWFLDLDYARQIEIAAQFEALPIALEVETPSGLVGIVHADCPFDSWEEMVSELGGDDASAIAEVCLLSRERITAMDDAGVGGVDRVFVGHTPVLRPMSLGNVHYIDTGAVFGRALTLKQIN
ncbi:serine/threonine protein phosphatase [Massilia sp. Dwa41.01b]|uniref:metallophosphoesterase n=1 Tax=unclassified Massilia TaxID=2609279 RepID=UPI00160486E0|nr:MULTISPECIES: metallophosphoesterase [unclassified Massilia]QNA89325.1 serine/threonine protein phosphatase [Massilia sp. Dwa41.01b]QNB00225.1 serine/threonine protein phosphatase [Massilia sp. Se16.2.3]